MAFNIRSSAGWNRLWLVLAVPWWAGVTFKYWGEYPEYGPGYAVFFSPEKFAERQHRFLFEAGLGYATPLLAYVSVYVLILAARWILQGFRR